MSRQPRTRVWDLAGAQWRSYREPRKHKPLTVGPDAETVALIRATEPSREQTTLVRMRKQLPPGFAAEELPDRVGFRVSHKDWHILMRWGKCHMNPERQARVAVDELLRLVANDMEAAPEPAEESLPGWEAGCCWWAHSEFAVFRHPSGAIVWRLKSCSEGPWRYASDASQPMHGDGDFSLPRLPLREAQLAALALVPVGADRPGWECAPWAHGTLDGYMHTASGAKVSVYPGGDVDADFVHRFGTRTHTFTGPTALLDAQLAVERAAGDAREAQEGE